MSSPKADHRFTLSDYYNLEALDALRSSPPPTNAAPAEPAPRARRSPPGRPPVGQTSVAGPSTPSYPIITTTPSPAILSSPPRNSGNSLEIDFFNTPTTSRRPSISPSPSPDPLGVMAHPLGPGPQPYPASPDGHTSDTDDYIPDLTYPPRGYNYAPKQATRMHPSSGRDFQREGGMMDRAPGSRSPLSGQNAFAHAQRRAMSPGDDLSSRGLAVSPQNGGRKMSLTPSVHSDHSLAPSPSGMSDYGYTPSPMGHNASPFFDDEKLPGEKDMDAPLPTTMSRGLGTHGPSAHSRTTKHPAFREWFPKSWPCRLLMLVVFLEAVIDIAIQANILWRFSRENAENTIPNKERRLPVYLYIFVTAHIVQFALTIWAIRTRNTVQVIGLAIFNVLFLIYAAFEGDDVKALLGHSTATADEKNALLTLPIKVLTSVSVSVIAASVLAVVILTYFIWREFGWDIYRSLGADLRIRKYYFQYQVYECLVCFSFFFFAGFAVQFALLVLDRDGHRDPEYVVTWVMLPVSLLWLLMGLAAARFEWAFIMATFLIGLVGGTAYFIFKLVRIWTQAAFYQYVQNALTVFSVLSLIMIISTLIYGIIVWRNFNKGLRASLDNRRKERKTEQLALSNTTGATVYPAYRITID